ncbi:MAG: hypothetical protein V1720_21760 [bacterium]
MKKVLVVLVLALSVLTLQAGPLSPGAVSAVKYNNIEKNLFMGMDSNNDGLKFSSIYRLGEIKSYKAVIPLLSILKNNESESMRIISALSLYKIGDERGLFAIKQASKFDESERVRRMCTIFYNEFLSTQQ